MSKGNDQVWYATMKDSRSKQQDFKQTFYWNGVEVSEAMYRRKKFCICGGLNAPGKGLCKRCESVLNKAIKAQVEKKHESNG